ncbi:MAG: hypothetical protein QXU67_06100 [Candidatus Bathyarchaeia archaeon]
MDMKWENVNYEFLLDESKIVVKAKPIGIGGFFESDKIPPEVEPGKKIVIDLNKRIWLVRRNY